jgi:hypothetical protein
MMRFEPNAATPFVKVLPTHLVDLPSVSQGSAVGQPEHPHFFVGASFKQDCFFIREIDQDFEAFGRRDYELFDRDRGERKPPSEAMT